MPDSSPPSSPPTRPSPALRRLRAVLLCLIAGAVAGPAPAGLFVEVEFFGGVDIAGFETWAWRDGNSAANYNVETAIRTTVEERMAARGYRRTDGPADCHAVTRVSRDEGFPAGVLRVEIVDAASEELVWRGMATGVIASSNPKKVASTVRRAVKKMFKEFPKSRSGS